jgi:hypothetical protein
MMHTSLDDLQQTLWEASLLGLWGVMHSPLLAEFKKLDHIWNTPAY